MILSERAAVKEVKRFIGLVSSADIPDELIKYVLRTQGRNTDRAAISILKVLRIEGR